MRKLLSLLILISITQLLTAQNEPLQGSWIITRVDNLNQDRPAIGDLDYEGQKYHFLDKGLMIIESDQGYFITSSKQENNYLIYNDFQLKYHFGKEDELHIFYQDSLTNRHCQIYLAPGNSLKPEELSEIEATITPKNLAGLPLNGFFYRYNANFERYNYIRFFADSSRISTSLKVGPEEALPYLNPAYPKIVKLKDIQAGDNPDQVKTNSLSYYTLGRGTKKERTNYTLSSYELDGVTLKEHQLRYDSKGDTLSDESYDYQFQASNQLSHWLDKPGNSDSDNPKYFDLLLPTNQKFNGSLVNVEDMPRFPGCEEVQDKTLRDQCSTRAMLEFIYSNLKYPVKARENSVEGLVVISFIIEKDGKVSNIKAIRDIGGGCGKEGIRVVQKMNDDGICWIPGRQRGKEVRVQFNLPLRFNLEGKKKKKKKKKTRG